jgi:hypothetical protein
MKNSVFTLVLMLILLFSACGDSGVQYAGDNTDEEAFFNIITIDYPALFELNLHDISIPDTTLVLAGPFLPQHYWYDIEAGEAILTTPIFTEREYPDAIVSAAQVSKIQVFSGTLEIIAIDTSNGGDTPVRMSKEVSIEGRITAIMEKWGLSHNPRRGWLLKEINHAYYQAGSNSQPEAMFLSSSSYDSLNINLDLFPLGEILSFNTGEAITVTVITENSGDLVRVTYSTSQGKTTQQAFTNQNYESVINFNLSDTPQANHFLIDIIYNEALTDTTDFISNSWGVLYSTQ